MGRGALVNTGLTISVYVEMPSKANVSYSSLGALFNITPQTHHHYKYHRFVNTGLTISVYVEMPSKTNVSYSSLGALFNITPQTHHHYKYHRCPQCPSF